MWVRQDKQTVLRRLADGATIQTIGPRANGALDEFVALSAELETFRMLDDLEVRRERQGSAPSLVSDPAILGQLGDAPVELAEGVSARHRPQAGKTAESIPVPIDTGRDELARLRAADGEHVQTERVRVLDAQRLIRSTKVVVDGRGLGDGERVVPLAALTGHRADPVGLGVFDRGRRGEGEGRRRHPHPRRAGAPGGGPLASSLLIADAFSADGPCLAWLTATGSDGLVRRPEDRLLFAAGLGVIELEGDRWEKRRQTRPLDGHQETRPVEVARAHDLTEWDRDQAKAREPGIGEPTLTGSFIRQGEPPRPAEKAVLALVSTQEGTEAWQTDEADRPPGGSRTRGSTQ